MSTFFDAYAAGTFIKSLFDLYPKDIKIRPCDRALGWGNLHGYHLQDVNGKQIGGSSIGKDELLLLWDIVDICRPASAYAVGVAFGLSTFALAVADPAIEIRCIDNFLEHRGGVGDTRQLFELVRMKNMLDNIRLTVGTSPRDTPAALQGLSSVDLMLIDGNHTNEAAAADYQAVRPLLTDRSVLLWHDSNHTRDIADLPFPTNSVGWQRHVLRTYGAFYIVYNLQAHPRLDFYLKQSSLIWFQAYRWIDRMEKS